MRSGLNNGKRTGQNGMNGSGQNNALYKRKCENLARTGTEYPIMKNDTKFILNVPVKEPLSDKPCAPALVDEYIMFDAERANNSIGTVIYDSVDSSPHYDGSVNDLYIDDRELIEMTQANQNQEGAINEPY
jgi:hypothetical protein